MNMPPPYQKPSKERGRGMDKVNKIRITCINCLYSKILPLHESDLKGTRFIMSEVCDKCGDEGDGLRYFNENMVEILSKEDMEIQNELNEAEGGWISVEERLPEFYNEYPAIFIDRGRSPHSIECWQNTDPGYLKSIYTHWMPLPPLPVNDKKEKE
jgi:hypothetical protein